MMNVRSIILYIIASPTLLLAALTVPSMGGGGGERKLTGQGGILDKLYGWENLVRINDSDNVITDQYWTIQPDRPAALAEIVAKNAGFSLEFGFLRENGGKLAFNSDLSQINADETVRLALNILSKPGFVWSSAVSDNKIMPNGHVFPDSSVIDHMITFQIAGSDKHHSNRVGNFVVAWEDLAPGNYLGKFDGDYNDLVVEISGLQPAFYGPNAAIPEPPTIALLALSGLMLIKKRPTTPAPKTISN